MTGVTIVTVGITWTALWFFGQRANRIVKAPADSPYQFMAADPGHGFAAFIAEKDTNVPKVKAHFLGETFAEFTPSGLKENLQKPRRLGNKITFKDVREHTDYIYETLPNGIKENIIVRERTGENKYTFTLATSGTSPKLVKDKAFGSVFYDDDGEYLFHMTKPFAVDADGNRTDDAHYLIQAGSEAGSYEVSLYVNSEWLADESRSYPVTIDPTIIYDTSSEFSGGQFNRAFDAGSGVSPRLETYYQELSADAYTVGLWHMNETSGTAVADSSGNGNNGTASNATADTANVRLGAASRFFNGTNASISFTNNASLNSPDFSIEAWINPSSISTTQFNEILTTYQGAIQFRVEPTVNKLYGYVYNGSTWTDIPGNATIATNTWTHVSFVKQGVTGYLYVNGVLDAIKRGVPNPAVYSAAAATMIGDFPGGGHRFHGYIDEVRLSNTARSAEEIMMSAQRRPYSVYTSPVIDFNSDTSGWNPFSWTEMGVRTGDGETPKDTSGLVAQWNFNETSGTTLTANAGSCGSSCNGSLAFFGTAAACLDSQEDTTAGCTSSGWTADNRRWGAGALMFDGTDDYVSVPDHASLALTSTVSVESWFKYDKLTSGSIFNRRNASNIGGYILETGGVNGISFYVYTTGWASAYSGDGVLTPGQWYHAVGTYDGSAIRLYLNGRLVKSAAISGAITNPASPLVWIGKNIAGNTLFDGTIDSTRVYSRALSAEEVLSNYNVGNLEVQSRTGTTSSADDGSWNPWAPITGETLINSFDSYKSLSTESNLVSYWPMEERSDTAGISDRKGTNNFTAAKTSVTGGKYGYARTFYGPGNYLASSDSASLDISGDMTMMAWVYRTGGVNGYILSKNGAAGAGGYALLHGNAGEVYCRTDNGTISRDSYTDQNRVTTSSGWVHVAAVKTGTSCRVYINGTDRTATTQSHTISNNNLALKIGAASNDNSSPFYGHIDEVRIYNAALSASDIQTAMNYPMHSMRAKLSRDTAMKMEGSASLKIDSGRLQNDAYTAALWHMDETSGTGAYIQDASGRGNHGTPTGTSVTDGISGRGRSYSGSGNYITVPDETDLNPQSQITIEAWFKTTTSSTNPYDAGTLILDKLNNSSPFQGYRISNGGNKFNCWVGGSAYTTSTTNVNDGKWHHGACTYDGTHVRVYVDGALEAVLAQTASLSYPTSLLLGNAYTGKIDEVRISNRARTAEEIRDTYIAGSNIIETTTMSSLDLSTKSLLPFYVAGSRPGTKMTVTAGESAFVNNESDSNTIALLHLDDYRYATWGDTFAGTVLDDGKWQETDTADKLVVNQGLDLSAGVAAAWDSGIISRKTFYGTGGSTLYFRFTTGASVAAPNHIMVGWGQDQMATPSYTAISHALYINAGAFHVYQDGVLFGGPYGSGFAANTTYEARIILNTGGTATYQIRGGAYENWTTLLAADGAKSHISVRAQVAQYRFDGAIHEISVSAPETEDSSAYNNHASSVGVNHIPGKIGGARYTSGGGGYLSLGSPANLDFGNNGPFTFSGWVYPGSLVDYASFVSKDTAGRTTPYSFMTVFMADGRLSAHNGSAWIDICPAGSVANGKWHHVAFVYNGSVITGYVDGARCGSASFSYTDYTAHEVTIGSWYGPSTVYDYIGYFDEIAISNVARTADEIRQAAEITGRSHQVTIDFGAKLDAGNLITGSGDTGFTVDATYYGLPQKGSALYTGDKVVVRENVGGTEYTAQGTVSTLVPGTGAATVTSWDAGSTFPASGFTANAEVFKWQREIFDLSRIAGSHKNAVTHLTYRLSGTNEGTALWIDDLKSLSSYLSDPTGSTLTSPTGEQYFQYRFITSSADYMVSPYLSAAELDFTTLAPDAPTAGTPAAVSDTSVQWNFTDNADDEDGFRLFDTNSSQITELAQTNQSSITETGLTPNTQYVRKITAYNEHGDSLYSDTVSKYTLAGVPVAPEMSNRTAATIDVHPSSGINPVSTLLAVYKDTGDNCDGSGGNYLAANGSSNGSTPVWQTGSSWGTVTVSGLSADTGFSFCVKAKNADDIETDFSARSGDTAGYIPISGGYVFSGSGSKDSSTFINRFVDGNNENRRVLGVDNGSSDEAVNTAVFEVQSGILALNAIDTLAVGSLKVTGGSIAIANGSTIEVGKSIWTVDTDGDGYSKDFKLFVGSKPTGGRRKNALSTQSGLVDCDDNNVSIGNISQSTFYQDADGDGAGRSSVSQVSCTAPSGYVANNTDCNDGSNLVSISHAQCHTDADGDTYTSGLAANTTCLNNASCASATRASASTHGAGVSTYTAGRLRDSASASLDCNDNSFSSGNSCFMAATGGTITTSGNYRIHTFTGSGTFTVTALGANNTIEYLIVAGGGGGGLGTSGGSFRHGGGGGAGGMLTGSVTGSQTAYAVTVGGGGGGAGVCGTGGAGGNSSVFGLTAIGGGGGGGCQGTAGAAGGSGGGAAGNNALCTSGGAGTGGQGNAGGSVCNLGVHRAGAGGGGRGGGVANGAGPGGVGLASSISGASVTYAAGGPGASWVAGTANRGNGGGGGVGSDSSAQGGAPGGSGIVIVRYIYQ